MALAREDMIHDDRLYRRRSTGDNDGAMVRSAGRMLLVTTLAAAVGSCSGQLEAPRTSPGSIRVLLVGDVMLGRGVADIAREAPISVFEKVESVLRDADLTLGNLESPFATAAASGTGPHDLRAHPDTAQLLAMAGFDVMGLANNHAADGGRRGIIDSADALENVNIAAVGGGPDRERATAPALFEHEGVSVAVLAFDATGLGPQAGVDRAGVAEWDPHSAERAVRAAQKTADVVVVGIHGGSEYLTVPDADLAGIAELLASWNVDVVWGHGPHVVHPVVVSDPDGDGRPALVATSLGNFLFDQDKPGTTRGAVLEVLAGTQGIVAYRVGASSIDRGRADFDRWIPPAGDAVLMDEMWWSPVAGVSPLPTPGVLPDGLELGEVITVARGNVTGQDSKDLVVAFRRPFRPTAYTDLRPGVGFVDGSGRSAHLGVFAGDDLRARWVAGTLARPVQRVAACDGSIAVAYSTLDDPAVVAAGGWTWVGFGFAEAHDLEGPAEIGCLDIDGDGSWEPAVSRSGEPNGPAELTPAAKE